MSVGPEGGSSQGGSGKTDNTWNLPAPPSQVSGSSTASTWTRGVWFPQPGASGSILFPGRQSQKLDVPDRPAPAYGYYPATQLGGAWEFLDPVDRTFFDVVAKAGSSRSTGEGLYRDLLAESERFNALGDSKVSPFDLLKQVAEQRGIMDSTGQITEAGAGLYQSLAGGPSDSSGSGAYTGPVSTITRINDADLRMVTDTIASTVLGRGVTKQEYAKIAKRVRGAETANPSVYGGAGAVQENVSGLSQEARQDVITKALLRQGGAEEFTMATKFMDLFNKALQERPDGA